MTTNDELARKPIKQSEIFSRLIRGDNRTDALNRPIQVGQRIMFWSEGHRMYGTVVDVRGGRIKIAPDNCEGIEFVGYKRWRGNTCQMLIVTVQVGEDGLGN